MLNIIGIGPSKGNITLDALKALDDSDIIIGYKKYIDSISDIIEGKEVIKKGMGDEVARGELAISKSLEGNNVAIISSGDPGVYGMANLIFQLIGKYDDVDVRIYPGVSALNYSADLLGAPLHDFATISLSNLLTPLSEIKTKIEHAAKGNFIIAVYNPISKSRKEPFRLFKKILLDIRGPETLVGIVDSSSYPSKTTIVNLSELNEEDINMFSCLIVGNKLTYLSEGYMVTPRGYAIKNDIHPASKNFYEKFFNGDTPTGPNYECEYYPCHVYGQYCDFCYCPFYPCGDGSTGGKWIKGKDIWSCEDCTWIHSKDAIECIKKEFNELVENVEDLNHNKKDLLKLRRHCILKTK